jgi:hypothetical protein
MGAELPVSVRIIRWNLRKEETKVTSKLMERSLILFSMMGSSS